MALGSAQLLASNPTARWLIENSPIKLQIARVWPFMGVDGGSLHYARENSPLTDKAASIINNGDPAPDGTDSAQQSMAFEFNEFMTSYQINAADQDRYRHPVDPDAAEYALALRRLLYAYFQFLDDGTDGLQSDALVETVSGALTLAMIETAYQRVTANDGRPTVIMSNTAALAAYHNLCRAQGYDQPQIPWQWYDPASGQMKSGLVTAFNGTPWLVNDLMASGRIFFMVLGDDGKAGPTRGVTGIVPEALKQSMFVKRTTMGVPAADPPEALHSTLITWVTWPAGFAVGAQGAIVLLEGFTIA